MRAFRALAYVEGHICDFASLRAMRAVLDGEIVWLDAQGRSQFYPLLFRATGRTSWRSICWR